MCIRDRLGRLVICYCLFVHVEMRFSNFGFQTVRLDDCLLHRHDWVNISTCHIYMLTFGHGRGWRSEGPRTCLSCSVLQLKPHDEFMLNVMTQSRAVLVNRKYWCANLQVRMVFMSTQYVSYVGCTRKIWDTAVLWYVHVAAARWLLFSLAH